MPFLSTLEEMALEQGQEKGAKENCQENILELLEKRFKKLPESLRKTVKQLDDLALLKRLHLETISVNSVEEFEQLINHNLSNSN